MTNPKGPSRVVVADATGWNMSLHPDGPKWTFKCGRCSGTWRHRLPMIDNPTLVCPFCGTLNTVPVTLDKD